MLLSVRYRTLYHYEPAASRVGLRLRLYPSRFDGQNVRRWSVTVNGSDSPQLLTDGFGDGVGLWHHHGPCESVEIAAEGVVETSDKAGMVHRLPRRPPPAVFLRQTELTEPDDAIRALAQELPQGPQLERMHLLSDAVREAVEYRAQVTTSETTAAEALAAGAGVCQDHAHVFIAAARSTGTPARYVAGFMLAGEGDEQEAYVETHAWAEAHIEDLGWVGFDPSNGVSPTERYIRLSCGLDAHQAAPIRGHVTGNSRVGMEAHVDISQVQQ
jgi:transglutaminase-like putative cysteine protease